MYLNFFGVWWETFDLANGLFSSQNQWLTGSLASHTADVHPLQKVHINLPGLRGRCHPFITVDKKIKIKNKQKIKKYMKHQQSRPIKLRLPGDAVGAAWGWKSKDLIYSSVRHLISTNIIAIIIIQSGLWWREQSLTSPSWLRVWEEMQSPTRFCSETTVLKEPLGTFEIELRRRELSRAPGTSATFGAADEVMWYLQMVNRCTHRTAFGFSVMFSFNCSKLSQWYLIWATESSSN